MKKLTQKRLMEVLNYDKDSGVFTWKIRYGKRAVGDIAGYDSHNLGFLQIWVDGKMYYAHRLAWLYVFGYFPEHHVGHVNKNRKDNRISNLREASRSCNLRNSKLSKNNNSGITGVRWEEDREKYRAYIAVFGKYITLGRFDSKLSAAKARWRAEVLYDFPTCKTTSTALKYIEENKRSYMRFGGLI